MTYYKPKGKLNRLESLDGISDICQKYPVEVFNSFQCPQNIDPLLISQLYIHYHTNIRLAVVNEVIAYTLNPLLPTWIER